MTNLTEQYRELEQDFFAYQKMLNEANKDLNRYYLENTKLKETISNDIFLIKSRDSEIVKLKELLKECELWFTGIVGNMNDKNVGEHNRNIPIGNFEYIFKVFSQKINQVLGEE